MASNTPRFKRVVSGENDERIQFTPEEEAEWDAQEVRAAEKAAIREALMARQVSLNAKLADDSITFDELKELMRLRG